MTRDHTFSPAREPVARGYRFHQVARWAFVVSVVGLIVTVGATANRSDDFMERPGTFDKVVGMSPIALVGLSALVYLVAYWGWPKRPWSQGSGWRVLRFVVWSITLLLVSITSLLLYWFAVGFVG